MVIINNYIVPLGTIQRLNFFILILMNNENTLKCNFKAKYLEDIVFILIGNEKNKNV
jgi:hypothetical protein